MKVPDDAVVVWRCECGGPCGYVRRVDGQLAVTAQVRNLNRGREKMQHIHDVVMDAHAWRWLFEVDPRGMTVSCGSHFSRASKADVHPGAKARRKVTLQSITRDEVLFGQSGHVREGPPQSTPDDLT